MTPGEGNSAPRPPPGASPQESAVLVDLVRASHEMDPGRVGELALTGARRLGASDCTLHVVGMQQRMLVPVDIKGTRTGEPIPIEGTLAGRAFVSGESQLSNEDGSALWVPLIDGVDRLGVLHLRFEDGAAEGAHWAEDLAGVVTLLLVTKSAYTDIYSQAARLEEMTLAAELIWTMLPPLTLLTPRAAVAGILEPAYAIGGDTFDYAISDSELYLSVFDSMGHGLESVGASILAVTSGRHSRRRGLGLAETAAQIESDVREISGGERFVTAILASLSLSTGRLQWINAGHPHPLLAREGRVVGQIPCQPSLPLGIGTGPRVLNEIQLQPGDLVVMFTDGVTEGRRPGGESFGEQRFADEIERAVLAGLPPAETMRRAAHAVLDHHDYELRDDFTIVLFEYRSSSAEE